MSQFTLSFEGNLAAKPELEYTATGQALCRLRIAHNRRRKTEGQWVDTTPMWVQVTVWGELAERCAELSKGDTVVVNARDDLNVWPFTRQDGTPGGVLEVTAENVSVSMRFTGALPVPSDHPAGEAWDPATAEPEAERELQAA
ncbi:single-stranded DNA-binding protein [Nucisporomicrobium flavum]|uniref:single-stranded DNA-binding protein n=1 Tax=Nucisporomicrobium flavum TaxID=2785915 RepID=UPI0018F28CF6|nr:single-stranded DNA-binding protein [Nucisporomicrobium flavum]